ncbi:hypothetical protein BN1708_012199, partial [Verticillium longisporum]
PTSAAHPCLQCSATFKSWKSLQTHREEKYQEDGSHVHCATCGLTFGSVIVMVHHVKRTHGREQDLKCPGCDARFARAGGLMGHLEYEECSAIPKSALDAYRTKKLAMPLALEKLSLTESDSDKADSIAGNAHDWVRHPAENQAPANRLSFAPDAFPILPNQASQVPQPQDQRQQPGGKDLTDAWGRQENLFPNATAVQRPTSEQLAEATRPNAKSEYLAAIHDPNHQDFDAEKYFNDFNNLFECPMKGCPQSFDSAVAITNHLVTRGMHGTGDRLQCPACLRFFVGVTAMTQHAESQSTRCNIRTSAKYRPFLAQLTAGVMDAVGQHSDTTIKYEVTNEALIQYGKVNRKPNAVVGVQPGSIKLSERADYWRTHEVKDAEW